MNFNIDCYREGYFYLEGDVRLVVGERILEEQRGNDILFIRRTNIEGIYDYGIEQGEEDCLGHKKGYIWASRASVMNTAFNTCLIEARYKQTGSTCYHACAVDLVRLEHMLEGTPWSINWTPDRKASDTTYKINVDKLAEVTYNGKREEV